MRAEVDSKGDEPILGELIGDDMVVVVIDAAVIKAIKLSGFTSNCAVAEAAFDSPVGTDDMTGYVLEKADFNVDAFCDEGQGGCNVEDGFVAWFLKVSDFLVPEMTRTLVD